MIPPVLLLFSISIFCIMAVMTIQGDIRDLDIEEASIPAYLGSMGEKLPYEGTFINWRVKVLLDSLISAKMMSIGLIVWGDDSLFGVWVALFMTAFLVADGIIKKSEEGDEDRVTKYITYYTALVLAVVCIGLYRISDIESVVLLISASFIWGFGFQKVLYGDKAQFG